MNQDWKKHGATRIATIVIGACVVLAAAFLLLSYLPFGKVDYSMHTQGADVAESITAAQATTTASVEPPPFVVTHLPTPVALKAIYLTNWAAGTPSYRAKLFDTIDTTQVNAVVIDIKDYTGRIGFPVDDPVLVASGAEQDRIPDIKEFIASLHAKGIYVIGRISSFQDSYIVTKHPEWAVATKEGGIWQDTKGVKWLDPGNHDVWDYLTAIGKQSYAVGFDELNFDYIRFPSDGKLEDMSFPSFAANGTSTKSVIIKDFFSYLHDTFAPLHIPISADLFGLTTSATDDMGIGQILENALPYFDYVSPMVYPSHFGHGFIGYAKPAEYPYEVIKYSIEHAVERAQAASSSPSKLRPWLQAFDLGAIYTPEMIRKEMQATYDVGLNSWLLWNAASVYQGKGLPEKGS